MTCKITIFPGRNAWLLARTDRDGASEAEVLQSAVAFMSAFLGDPLKPYEVLQLPDGRGDVATASMGSARPVVISAERGGPVHEGRALPGQLIARQQNCDKIFTIAASKPWWVRVGFDWRGGQETIDWPRLRVNALGMRDRSSDHQNDWLLVEARYMGPEMGADESWSEGMINAAGDQLSNAAVALGEPIKSAMMWVAGLAAVAVVGGVLLYSYQKGSTPNYYG